MGEKGGGEGERGRQRERSRDRDRESGGKEGQAGIYTHSNKKE